MSINQRPPHLLRWPVQHCPAKQQIIRQFGEDAEKILVGRGQQPDRAQFTSTTPVLGVKITRAVTSRSVSAGVVEIRKAFERVKEELETESNCNYGQFGKRQFGKLQAAPLAIFAPAARLFVPLPAPTRPHVFAGLEDSSLPFGYGYGFVGVGYGGYYGGITSLASSTSLISPQVLHFFLISPRREMFRDKNTTRVVTR